MSNQDSNLIYLAGIVDGEGSIILERRTSLRPQEKSTVYVPRITVTNTDNRLMDWLIDNFRGNVTKIRCLPPCKDVYNWNIAHKRAIMLARLLMPFLKLKSVQAYCISCFELEAQWSKGGKPEDTKMPDYEIERREMLY